MMSDRRFSTKDLLITYNQNKIEYKLIYKK